MKIQKKQNKAKMQTLTLPIVITGVDNKGNEYDTASCTDLVNDLNKAGVFQKLAVNVNISRSLFDPELKGQTSVGSIIEVDDESNEATILVFAKYNESIDLMKDLFVVPRVRINKADGTVLSILRFDLVQAMEA